VFNCWLQIGYGDLFCPDRPLAPAFRKERAALLRDLAGYFAADYPVLLTKWRPAVFGAAGVEAPIRKAYRNHAGVSLERASSKLLPNNDGSALTSDVVLGGPSHA
jgi:hypothetical protein